MIHGQREAHKRNSNPGHRIRARWNAWERYESRHPVCVAILTDFLNRMRINIWKIAEHKLIKIIECID